MVSSTIPFLSGANHRGAKSRCCQKVPEPLESKLRAVYPLYKPAALADERIPVINGGVEILYEGTYPARSGLKRGPSGCKR